MIFGKKKRRGGWDAGKVKDDVDVWYGITWGMMLMQDDDDDHHDDDFLLTLYE